MKFRSVIRLFVIAAVASSASAREPLTDHPLVSPYEGSVLKRKNVQEFDEYAAFRGMDADGKTPLTIPLEGKVTKLFYAKPKERSILEVFRNYETAVNAIDAEILFTCNQKKSECAERYAGPTLQKVSDIHAMQNRAGRYLLARTEREEHVAYVAIAVGPLFTDIHVIEVQAMDKGMVSLDAAALGEGLDARGYVVVEGIFFDTDKASLKPESTPALAEMARLLTQRPELQVYVVGHTDMQGDLAYNRDLSRKRARTVVEALATEHGVDRGRMEGYGVGPLAPQATNRSDEGRAKNRRVVLVAR